MGIQRYAANSISLDLNTTLATTPAIPYGSCSGGTIHMPSTASTSPLTFYSSSTVDGTYVVIHDAADVAVTRTVTVSKAYAMPDECFGCYFVKIVPGVNCTITLTLKG